MTKAARAERLASGRAIGRICYRLVRAREVQGYVDDGRKRWRTYQREMLRVDLYETREPSAADFSAIVVTYNGAKRLHIAWNAAGEFKLLHFDRIRTDWLRWLDVEPQQHRRRARA